MVGTSMRPPLSSLIMAKRISTGGALTIRGIANLYSVHRDVIYGWIRDGHIRPLRLPGNGPYRFRQADLDDFEARCLARDSTDPTIDSDNHETETVAASIGIVAGLEQTAPIIHTDGMRAQTATSGANSMSPSTILMFSSPLRRS
jgi:excisionase family DNA binding protein